SSTQRSTSPASSPSASAASTRGCSIPFSASASPAWNPAEGGARGGSAGGGMRSSGSAVSGVVLSCAGKADLPGLARLAADADVLHLARGCGEPDGLAAGQVHEEAAGDVLRAVGPHEREAVNRPRGRHLGAA